MTPREKVMKAPRAVLDQVEDAPHQRKKIETGQFRLQVDRQTKAFYVTLEAAQEAGQKIKAAHPQVQVAVYDVKTGTNTVIGPV
jgi:hypothetical protein